MATINEIARMRKAAFRSMLKELRDVDTAVEAAERFGKRVLSRKRDVPTNEDLERFIDLTGVIMAQFDGVAKTSDAALRVWGNF